MMCNTTFKIIDMPSLQCATVVVTASPSVDVCATPAGYARCAYSAQRGRLTAR